MTVERGGPYEAAVDLQGSGGEGGFDQLILWHDRDNAAVFQIADALERAGWRRCYTGTDRWGDQAIYTHDRSPVRVSMDLSFYAKRRIRIIPLWNRRDRLCGAGERAAGVPAAARHGGNIPRIDEAPPGGSLAPLSARTPPAGRAG